MRKFLNNKKTLKSCRIFRMLATHAGRRHLSFHTPGHKVGRWDITELSFSDNLASPSGCIALAEEEIGAILGAKRSFILTDGSTSGVLSMLYAARSLGVQTIAAPTLSHQSFFNGVELLGLTPVLFQTKRLGDTPLPLDEGDFSNALQHADALFLTSPDYYGNIPDLSTVKRLCDEQGKLLLIDGAHGGHLHFERKLYAGQYAHLWVDGVHKSLPAFTQGAVVSASTEKGAKALQTAVRIFRTSSPSYPMMASVEYAVKYPRNLWLEKEATALALSLQNAYFGGDWTKLCVRFQNAELIKNALEKKGIYPEFIDGNLLMFYLSPATKKRDFLRLKKLLKALENEGLPFPNTNGEQSSAPFVFNKLTETEEVELQNAEGRICACVCGLFPPCLPLFLKGETITKEKIEKLLKAPSTFGLQGNTITVVKNDEEKR